METLSFAYQVRLGNNRGTPQFSHEPDGQLWLYYLQGNLFEHEFVEPDRGQYHNIENNFIRVPPPSHLLGQINLFTIRQVPHVGGSMMHMPVDGIRSQFTIPFHTDL